MTFERLGVSSLIIYNRKRRVRIIEFWNSDPVA